MTDRFFTPTQLGDIVLANRLVMAPMSRNRATPEGLATPLMATYYAQRATAGLIISEGVQPNAEGQGFVNTPGLETPAQVEAWRVVTGAVRQAGGRMVAQLMHAGRIGHPSLYPDSHVSVAPSAVTAKGEAYTPSGMQPYPTPRALDEAEIVATIEAFAAAARNAIAAGFDGVEIHAGNGFLPHQFLSSNANQRGDRWGGSIANRIRFAVETARAVVAAIGAGRTGMRISPANPYNDIVEADTPALYSALLAALPELAFLHVMEAGNRAQTEALRAQWRGGLIVNPHAGPTDWPASPAGAAAALDAGLADAVAFGALFLANPDLVERLRRGAGLNSADPATFYGGGAAGYTDYPTLAAEPA